MSTKTTFKRIALVAVAALGLGVLSVAPSSADVSGVTVTVTNGTATTMNSDSSTAATIKVSFLALAGAADSVTVAVASAAAFPATAVIPATQFLFHESTTSVALSAGAPRVDTSTINSAFTAASQAVPGAAYPSSRGAHIHAGSTANGTYSATMRFWLGETSTSTQVTPVGTYSFNAIVTSQNTSTNAAPVVQVVPFTIVVSAVASASETPSAAYSSAYLGLGSTADGSVTADAAGISYVSTASTSNVAAKLKVNINNASNTADVALDTVTITISGPGVVLAGGAYAKTVKRVAVASAVYPIYADGNAGATTITVSLDKAGLTFTKSLSFYASAAKTITATNTRMPILAAGANSGAVSVSAVDANGTPWTGTAYIVASSDADALVAGSTTPVQCAAWNATDGIRCPVTAATIGTAKLKVIDASTVAAATATSNEVTVTVKAQIPSSLQLAFDKTSYAPNEKAFITITPLDSTGGRMQGTEYTSLLAAGGITSTSAFSTGSMDSLTVTTINVSKTTSSTSNTTAGSYTYVVYMPAASGDVTISATGGTALPAAAQIKYSATATVVNASVDAATDAANEATDAANAATDAALAAADAADAATAAAQDASDAVAALSATVAKLVASLKAQITSLTNLVIKIQKKVKA
jgi:hypothetical protein